MNQRDIAALRKRLNPDDRSPSLICGCYVSADGQIMSTFRKEVALLPQEEFEKYAALFKKVYSGTQGQNLLTVSFAAAATMEDPAHALLADLCRTELGEEQVQALYDKILASMQAEREAAAQSVDEQRKADNKLILLLADSLDVARHHRGEDSPEDRDSVFNYFLCLVCPVKQTKPSLSWFSDEKCFHARPEDWSVSAPELGFLYPAMEEGSADIYSALFYSKSAEDMHEAFMSHVFAAESAMPAAEQQETFQAVLSDALQEECRMDVVQAVHEKVSAMIQETKENKQAEPLTFTRNDLIEVLETCGVSSEKAKAFDDQYTEAFGAYTELPAVNVVTPKQFRVTTPDVTITVNPERSDLVQTRVIDGIRYILVQADGDVEVNGVRVSIAQEG